MRIRTMIHTMETVWRPVERQRVVSPVECKLAIFDSISDPTHNAAKIRGKPFLTITYTHALGSITFPNLTSNPWINKIAREKVEKFTKYGSTVSNPRTTSADFPSKFTIQTWATSINWQSSKEWIVISHHLFQEQTRRWWCSPSWRRGLAWSHCWVRRFLLSGCSDLPFFVFVFLSESESDQKQRIAFIRVHLSSSDGWRHL